MNFCHLYLITRVNICSSEQFTMLLNWRNTDQSDCHPHPCHLMSPPWSISSPFGGSLHKIYQTMAVFLKTCLLKRKNVSKTKWMVFITHGIWIFCKAQWGRLSYYTKKEKCSSPANKYLSDHFLEAPDNFSLQLRELPPYPSPKRFINS